MKSEGQLRQKIKMVIFRHRKAYIQAGLAPRPHNCLFNEKVRLPVHMANRAALCVCQYKEEGDLPRNVICDSSMGGDKQAAECPYFQAARDADTLKAEFNLKLGIEGGTPVEIGYIAKEYPDVAALLWVMGPAKGVNKEEPAEEPQANILAFFGGAEEPEDLPERPLVEDTDEP
jgi:hypothetical protein